MINRELIRIKIVQLTYAYYQNGNRNMDNAEKELLFSLSKAYDLYIFLLALIVAVTKEARHRVEVITARVNREGGELPSEKFAYNKFAILLEENRQLNDFLEQQKQIQHYMVFMRLGKQTMSSSASLSAATSDVIPSEVERERNEVEGSGRNMGSQAT